MSGILINSERIQIFSLSKEDFGFIEELYNDYENNFLATNVKSWDENDMILKFKDEIINNYYFYVARDETTLEKIGYFKGFVSSNGENILWVSILIIKAKHMRQGYGSEMYKAIEKYFFSQFGIAAALLSVAEENCRSMSFWQRQGFTLYKTLFSDNIQNNSQNQINILKKFLK